MPDNEDATQRIPSETTLVEPFFAACKASSRWRIGVESEKFGLRSSGKPLEYTSDSGIGALFEKLCSERGWSALRDSTSGAIIALRRDQTSLTLEPGGQVELSGAPANCVHEVCQELGSHLNELSPFARDMDIRWLALGFHPTARLQDLPWVPKERYAIMREYLPKRGQRALDMMQRTCTVQVNMDFDSEQDAMRKLRVSLKLQPIATAIFANSPFIEGKVSKVRSQRAHVWLQVDPDRCGLLPFAWHKTATFQDYAQWALDVPMFFFQRGTKMYRNTGQSFRAFLAEGFSGERATFDDWQLHLSTLFPEVRLKNTIEVRGADTQGSALVCAVPALWKGVLYDPTALNEAEALVEDLTHDVVSAARSAIADNALHAQLANKPVYAWAEQLIDIAIGGLQRLHKCAHAGKDESTFLLPIQQLVAERRCPADVLLDAIKPDKPLLSQLFEHAAA